MLWLHILTFFVSFLVLSFSSRWLISALSRIAKCLGWKEFVVAFFLISFGVSSPNFFVGIISALNKIPELSFGDVIGGNVVEIALLGGLAALVSRMGLSAQSRTVQGSAFFAIGTALLPLLLTLDGNLSRSDGILLILSFVLYIVWLFTKEDRFKKVYDGISEGLKSGFFAKNLFIFLGSVVLVIFSAQWIVDSSKFFADYLNFPLAVVGILIVSLGNSLPDLSFVLHAARRSEDWLILGDLMGGTIITATLVLGIVSLICPIKITILSAVVIARIFLIIATVFFIFFIRTNRKISKKEGLFLLAIYIAFVIVEILVK